MTINEYQQRVDKWIQMIGIKYYGHLTNMALLTEEVGEVARLIARLHGEQSFKKEISEKEGKELLADELADVYFVLTCLANQSGINMEEAIEENLKKKTKRDTIRHSKNNG